MLFTTVTTISGSVHKDIPVEYTITEVQMAAELFEFIMLKSLVVELIQAKVIFIGIKGINYGDTSDTGRVFFI